MSVTNHTEEFPIAIVERLVKTPKISIHHRLRTMIKTIPLFIGFCCLTTSLLLNAAETKPEQEKTAADYLEFASELDNECQKRSPSGRLRLVRNLHPEKTIKYRFVRIFTNVRQPGFTRGTLEPNDEPTQLGCTKISGRDQTWEIVKAEFIN